MTAGTGLRVLRAAVFTAVCVTLSAAGHSLASGGAQLPPLLLALACAAVFAAALPLAGRERNLPGIAALLAAGQLALHTLFTCGGQTSAHRAGGPTGAAGLRELAAQLVCHGSSGMTDARARRVLTESGLSPGELRQAGGQAAPPGDSAGSGDLLSAGPRSPESLLPDSLPDWLRSGAHAALSVLDLPMLLGHVLVALALGWVLRRGEAALWRLVRLSARSAAAAGACATAVLRALRRAVSYVCALCAGLLPHAPARGFTARRHEQCRPPATLLHYSVDRRGPPAHALTLAA